MILYYLKYVCNIYNIGFVITIERLPWKIEHKKSNPKKIEKNGLSRHISTYYIAIQ